MLVNNKKSRNYTKLLVKELISPKRLLRNLSITLLVLAILTLTITILFHYGVLEHVGLSVSHSTAVEMFDTILSVGLVMAAASVISMGSYSYQLYLEHAEEKKKMNEDRGPQSSYSGAESDSEEEIDEKTLSDIYNSIITLSS